MNQLVSASEADASLGFMARTMALCSLPRSNPGNRLQYKRVNGPFTLYMNAVGDNKLPFGNLPRLLLAWVCTEAVRTQSRELVLGRSLSEFMRTLDIYSNSGRVHTRLRNQMKRLFGCTVTMVYEEPGGFVRVSSLVADKHEFWWNERKPDEPTLWESKIELGEKFFNEIIHHPVPIDMNTLTALKRSPLGLDLYLWLVYRTFALRAPLRLTWRQVYHQFGAHPDNACDKRSTRVTSLSLVRYRANDYSVPTRYGHRQVLLKGYVDEIVICCGSEEIARHRRSYEREELIFDPLHYLALLERKTNALDQAAPLAGWELPEQFAYLRRLLEARLGKEGKREYVQVLRLLEDFRFEHVAAAVRQACELGAIGLDAVRHLVLCRIEQRPPRLDLTKYPHLPAAQVEQTSAADYLALLAQGGQ